MADNWIEAARAVPVASLLVPLRLNVGKGHPPSFGPCPACGAERRGKTEKRPAVGTRRDGLGWQCHACKQTGDGIGLVKACLKADMAAVRAFYAAHGLGGVVEATYQRQGPRRARRQPVKPRPAPPPAPPPDRPPEAEVTALWEACHRLPLPTGRPMTELDMDAHLYMHSRGLHPADLGPLDVCRWLPEAYPWPRWWPGSWKRWRIVIQAFEADGRLASLHARAIDRDADTKTRWPWGYSSGCLLFADPLALGILKGTPPPGIQGVLIVEGLPDFLSACLMARREGLPLAVLGGASGSFPALARVRWPDGLALYCATHPDPQGDKYAAEIAAALAPRSVSRVNLKEGVSDV